jgi:zinc protease
VRHVVLADQRVAQPSLQRSYLVPSIATGKPGEAEAIAVLVHALGSGSTSRLYRELIAEKGLAADAGAWYQDAALDQSRLGVYGTPRPGVSLHQLEDAIDGVIAEVIEKGMSPEEVERAKNRMIAAYVYAQDNQTSLARLYGAALTTGSTVEEVQSRPERLRAVTAEAVNAAARQWLDSRRSTTGYLVHDLKQSEDKRS